MIVRKQIKLFLVVVYTIKVIYLPCNIQISYILYLLFPFFFLYFSADPVSNISLTFGSKEAAINYAEKQGIPACCFLLITFSKRKRKLA